jgi:uncharacterized Tic20 family protein
MVKKKGKDSVDKKEDRDSVEKKEGNDGEKNVDRRSFVRRDNTLIILTHFVGIFTYFLGSFLVLFLTKDIEVQRHAKNALNWQLSLVFYSAFVFVLSLFDVIMRGVFFNAVVVFPFSFLFSVLIVLNIVFCIVASVRAGEGVLWDYPLSLDIVGMIDPKVIVRGRRRVRRVFGELRDK